MGGLRRTDGRTDGADRVDSPTGLTHVQLVRYRVVVAVLSHLSHAGLCPPSSTGVFEIVLLCRPGSLLPLAPERGSQACAASPPLRAERQRWPSRPLFSWRGFVNCHVHGC